jgi:hypothetical protein
MAIRTSSNTPLYRSLPPVIPPGTFIICGNGKFRLIFQDMINATGAGFDDLAWGPLRRNVVCDVVNYIESVIDIPSNIGATDPTIDIIFNLSVNTPTSGLLASAAPVFSANFYTATPTITPGYYGGYLYDYITTGVKPDINSEEAQVTVNFGHDYTYFTSIIGDCQYDFFSIILHELTHGLGFFSMGIDNSGVLSSRFASNVFSKLDEHYLYYNNGSTFDKLFSITTYSANNGVNTALPLNAASTNRVWLTNSNLTNKQNQPVYSQSGYSSGTSLSHLDNWYEGRSFLSPGYSPNYLMSGSLRTHQLKRTFTLQEIEILQTMGYNINSTFPLLSQIGNQTPYHAGSMITGMIGFGGYMNTTPASGLTDLTFSTTSGNNVTLNLSTGIVSNGTITQNLNFIDGDSDPITVYEPQAGWKGLYNIRGCGSGNNSNQLSVNATRDIITFTPRNNFIGRAQFAFHLYDGKQRGDYVVFTIDVARGGTFVNTPANELVINGAFEEGTEVREVGANEFNLVAEEIDLTPNYCSGKVIPDGSQYGGWGWNDPCIRDSRKLCLFPTGQNPCFDNCNGAAGSPLLPTGNIGNRYVNFFDGEQFNITLAEPILPCTYQLEADIYIPSTYAAFTASSTINFFFHNQGINGNVLNASSPTLHNASSVITNTMVNTWQHITIPITYTASSGANFVQLDALNFSGNFLIDNISVIRTGTPPSITITPVTSTICAGQSAALTASGATSYTWSTGSNLSSINVTPLSTTVYTVTGINLIGCGTSSQTVSVTVTPNPTVFVSNRTICAGTSTVLTASGATTYSWNSGATTNTISVSPTTNTNYTVTGTTNGCTNTKTVSVTVTPNPTVAVSNATICSGTSTVLTASGAATYSWNTSATTNTISVSPTVNTNYTVTGTTNGCTNTKTLSVTVKTTPTVAVSNATICSGKTATLTASGATTYSWSTSATTSSITVSPTSNTNYTVTGTTNGCANTKTLTVTVNPSPTVTAVASPTSICVGQTVTLTASGAATYSWSTSSTNTVITVSPTVTTVYTATGTTAGCSTTKTVSVLVGPVNPTLTVNSSLFSICGTSSATMIASGANNYTWTPTGGNTATAVVTPTAITVYTVTGNNGTGCGASTKTVIVSPTSSLCCSTTTNVVGTSLTSSVNMASGTYAVAGTVIDMQGVITFTGNTTFNGYTFRMKPNTLLRVVGEYTLSLINCKLFSCSELWDGISLPAFNNDIHGHLLLNNTTVEDMYNGIVVEGNAWPVVTPTTGILISSTNSKLNKNYISMQFRNIDGMFNTATSSFTTTPYPFSMITTTISSYASTTSPGATLKPSTTYTYAYNTWAGGATSSTNTPFVSFPRTYTGIALNNMRALSPLIIGDSVTTGNTNTFDNMDFGITGSEATAKVHNNYFKNITGSTKQSALDPEFNPPAFGPDEIGIAVAMTHTTTHVQQLTVGTKTTVPSTGNPYPKGNVFEDCNKAIKALSCKNVYVKGNQFNATATSTITSPVNTYYYYKNQQAIWVSALSDENNLSYNYIRHFANGIYSSHTFSLTTPRPIVNYNDIAAPLSTGYCKQAIQISQVGGANIGNGSYSMLTNRIANVYNGISCSGVQNGLNIYGNDVSIESMTKLLGTTSTATRTAISLSGCQYGQVRGNTVYSNVSPVPTTSTTAGYLTGVALSNSPNNRVECNLAHTTGRDFVFQGGCSGTKWLANTMQNSYRGLEMRLAAIIGDQGAPTYTGTPNLSANTWTTITQETYVLGTSNVNTLSKLYLLAGGTPKTQPTLNFATIAVQVYTTGISGGIKTATTGTSYTCNAGTAQRMSNDDNSNTNANNQKNAGTTDSLVEYTNLVTADESTYEVFTDEFEYLNKQLVYKLVEQDSINPSKGSVLDEFYNANLNTAIDKLTEVQIAIANNEVSSANSVNASVPITNQVEYKHQRANELTLKYMNDRNYTFTSNERSDLFNMANECIVKGYYVVQSRNIVDIITNQAISYDDNCEAEANASRKAQIEKTSEASYSEFNLFPNPNNGSMQLDYDLGGYANADFNLYDITGKQVNSYKLQNSKGILQMNEQNLHNGIYFYHILVGEKTIKTDKIVIIK